MPVQFTFKDVPAGVTIESALENEEVLVSTKAYLTSEDGADFVKHIESIWGIFSESIDSTKHSPSQIDNFLAVINRNKTCTLFCNELQQRALIRPKRSFQSGEHVYRDDIADIKELVFFDEWENQVEISPESGFALILSVGWRKCLCYDFEALLPVTPPRSINLPELFGGMYRNLMFQEMYSLSEQQWEAMLEQGWFPFIGLTQSDRQKIVEFSKRSIEANSVFHEICRNFQNVLLERSHSWRRLTVFEAHRVFIERATERFLANDYLSAIQILYPRIEGILRQFQLSHDQTSSLSQRTMVESLTSNQDDGSLLFPSRFRNYLSKFYFRSFDERKGEVPLSRNTVAHGTSVAEDYDLVKASLGFMIVDQIFYFLSPTKTES